MNDGPYKFAKHSDNITSFHHQISQQVLTCCTQHQFCAPSHEFLYTGLCTMYHVAHKFSCLGASNSPQVHLIFCSCRCHMETLHLTSDVCTQISFLVDWSVHHASSSSPIFTNRHTHLTQGPADLMQPLTTYTDSVHLKWVLCTQPWNFVGCLLQHAPWCSQKIRAGWH